MTAIAPSGSAVVIGKPAAGRASVARPRREEREQVGKKSTSVVEERKSEQEVETKRKMSFSEKKELEQLISDIEKMENEKQDLIHQLSDGDLSPDSLVKCSVRIKELTDVIDSKTIRWMELEELAE